MAFIIFLFYSNLLMGQFTKSALVQKEGFVWDLENIFTIYNFVIAVVTAFIGHLVFDYFRRKF